MTTEVPKISAFRILSAVLFVGALGLAFILFPQDEISDVPEPIVIGTVRLSDVDERTLTGFEAGLETLGWRIGKDVIIRNSGSAGVIENLDAMAADHVAAGVDMIFVSSTPGALAVKRATKGTDISVVFDPVNDPVKSGIVDSLERPGGNITGIKLPLGDDVRLQWLTKIAPNTTHVFVPYTKQDKSSMQSLDVVRAAALQMGIELITVATNSTAEARAVAPDLPAHVNAIYIPRDSGVEAAIDAYVEISLKRKIPISAPSYAQVQAGALYCFGFIHKELGKQGAAIADKILRGAEPKNTPVEVGVSYLTFNLKTAKAIGLKIPDKIIRQAAYVIR